MPHSSPVSHARQPADQPHSRPPRVDLAADWRPPQLPDDQHTPENQPHTGGATAHRVPGCGVRPGTTRQNPGAGNAHSWAETDRAIEAALPGPIAALAQRRRAGQTRGLNRPAGPPEGFCPSRFKAVDPGRRGARASPPSFFAARRACCTATRARSTPDISPSAFAPERPVGRYERSAFALSYGPPLPCTPLDTTPPPASRSGSGPQRVTSGRGRVHIGEGRHGKLSPRGALRRPRSNPQYGEEPA